MMQAVRSKLKGLGRRGCMLKHALCHTGFQGINIPRRTASLYFHCYFSLISSSFSFLLSRFFFFFLYFFFGIIRHGDKSFTMNLCWTYFLKTSFSLAYHISFLFQWVCSSSNHAYSHGWLLLELLKNETLLSQGLLDYSHVSKSLSNFTCSNIKTSSFDASLWYLWLWINKY